MFEIIVVGASAGGIQTFGQVIEMLPESFSWPILFVQHLSPTQDASVIAKILMHKTKLSVLVAEDGKTIRPRTIYISPADFHLCVERKKKIRLLKTEKIQQSRPSIDVLFKSVAEVFKERAMGIILTGANGDGAKGLALIKESGGYTIIQDPKSAIMNHMPNSALSRLSPNTILPPSEIGAFLHEMWLLSNNNHLEERKKFAIGSAKKR